MVGYTLYSLHSSLRLQLLLSVALAGFRAKVPLHDDMYVFGNPLLEERHKKNYVDEKRESASRKKTQDEMGKERRTRDAKHQKKKQQTNVNTFNEWSSLYNNGNVCALSFDECENQNGVIDV